MVDSPAPVSGATLAGTPVSVAPVSDDVVPDTEHKGLIAALPPGVRPFALLARFDRPIGWWLLFWPCTWGLFLAGGAARWDLLSWMLLGSIAMRGAGCVYNDIVDADLDARVARTALRPIPSGAVSRKAAFAWLLTLAAVGLVVLVQLRWQAELVALGSLGLVAGYPFMKRFFAWPQMWLGLVFTWGAPTAWVAVCSDHLGALAALYGGAIFWCVGYDTIYALQDREDDAIVGIRSSARTLGAHVHGGIALFYGLAVALWGLALWLRHPDPLALCALVPVAAHLGWQVVTLKIDDGADPLAKFRSNRFAGLLMALACLVVGAA